MSSPIDVSSLPEPFPAALAAVKAAVPEALLKPVWGIICGSGLSGLAAQLEDKVEVPYESIPGFPKATVAGHGSSLAFGYLSDAESGAQRVPVVAALGRFHTYEGHSPSACIFPTRLMKCLGIRALLVTNAAGGLNPEWEVGTIVALHDHLSLPTLGSMNPLIGANLPALGPRFPPTSDAYDPSLRLSFFRSAQSLSLLDGTSSGTYAYVMGPTYESRAECRFLRMAGADAVGMSTVPEVIAARHAGVRVLALSLITNKVVVSPYFDAKAAVLAEGSPSTANGSAAGPGVSADDAEADKDKKEAANHEEVLEVGRMRAEDMRRLVARTICTAKV